MAGGSPYGGSQQSPGGDGKKVRGAGNAVLTPRAVTRLCAQLPSSRFSRRARFTRTQTSRLTVWTLGR